MIKSKKCFFLHNDLKFQLLYQTQYQYYKFTTILPNFQRVNMGVPQRSINLYQFIVLFLPEMF